MANRSEYKPNKSFVYKTKEQEEELIIKWFLEQSNITDSLRFLIQKEIALNGISDLGGRIPRKRDIEQVRAMLISNDQGVIFQHRIIQTNEVQNSVTNTTFNVDVKSNKSRETVNDIMESRANSVFSTSSDDIVIARSEVDHSIENSNTSIQSSNTQGHGETHTETKRPAKKKFDPSVVGSFI
ncbi:hypothetical protein YDYSY3_39670 [Paenibacillus chitinolyticus]|uniref:hypothetical protein n=1 Tax=Paenibacillus chitinolyticus TaxID=79263 RepID=UPI0026E4F0CE|nr:hypothetical protein [Paenibacillus chitinolyticus]GKS12967.1 hypothetical protein YDYSY3_39670 [Paenibacillus chitinolyticus]